MVRRLGVLVVAVMVAGVVAAGAASAQDPAVADGAASTVRIQARLLDSGKVEFGLQLDGDRTWLPQARLFPYQTAEVGRWLFASPYTLSDGTTVRIQARLLDSGKVEFGLQLDGDRTWLPQARLFPYQTAEVGRWLFASPFAVPDDETPTATTAAPIVDQDDQQDGGSDEAPPTTTTEQPAVKPVNPAFYAEQGRLRVLSRECNFDWLQQKCTNGDDAMTRTIVQGYNDLFGCEYIILEARCTGQTQDEADLMHIVMVCGDTNWRPSGGLCYRPDVYYQSM